jgi:hypothetical protein
MELPNPNQPPNNNLPSTNSIQPKAAETFRMPMYPIILGTNGTGKTTFLKKLILNEMKKNDNHILILTPDDAEFLEVPEVHAAFPERIQRYSGARKMITTLDEAEANLKIVREYFRKGTLIFDDCRSYFKASTLSVLETIMVRRRQMMIDVIAVGHGPSKIPPAFFSYMTHIVLFKTNDPIKSRKDRLDDIARWEIIQARVNEKAITDPHYYEIHKI